MVAETVKLHFSDDFVGEVCVGDKVIKISGEDFKPYNLLFGALGSCFYHTFMVIAHKKRLSYKEVNIEISGVKRDKAPTILETVTMKITIKGADDEEKFTNVVKLACDNCSIHETIKQVAEIKTIIVYE